MSLESAENALLCDLLLLWEDQWQAGRDIPPEELGRDHPGIVAKLRRRIEELKEFDRRYGSTGHGAGGPATFPTSDRAPPPRSIELPAPEWGATTLVAGRYEILGEVGRGGMGIVYRAYDRIRREIVALKTVQRSDPTALLRFKKEFRVSADIVHPNLVALYELARDESHWFFTMELVEGVDILTYTRSRPDSPSTDPAPHPALPDGPDSPGRQAASDIESGSEPAREKSGTRASIHREAVAPTLHLDRLRKAFRHLGEGVVALHRAGIVHRDLKPSNVLVTKSGRVVVLDFGLAAELEASGLHQSSDPHVLGTVSYMAPEQAASLPVSPASDWYSVGVMLYEALTGRAPFRGTPLEVLMEKQQFEPAAPRALMPDVPEDLSSLCSDLLRRHPEARPAGSDILRRLGGLPGVPETEPGVLTSPRKVAPLIGRERHLEAISSAFEAVRQGRTIALYLHGQSGVGKTALVQRFLDDLIGRGEAVVLAGRCHERESVPYKALDSLVDALSRHLRRLSRAEVQALLPRDVGPLVRVFQVLRHLESVAAAPRRALQIPDPLELRRRGFAALRELLARLGDRTPLVLFIDDLQWGDLDSASLLNDLLRPPDPPVLLLLGCYRSEDATTSALVQEFHDARNGPDAGVDRCELAVEALSLPEAEALARILLGEDRSDARSHPAAIARESRGNPFFVAELVRLLQAGAEPVEHLVQDGQLALEQVLGYRIARLPDDARRLLEIVAVSGRPLGQSEACRAAGLASSGRTALAVLRAGRLIRGSGPMERDEIETYHDRIRETMVAQLAPVVREGHHLGLAQVLEATGRCDPEILAVHYQEAGRLERAGEYYAIAAARAAEALAFDRAAKLYRLALEFRPGDDDEVPRLRARLGDALANAGRGSEAAAEYLRAAVGATVAEALEFRRRAALQYLSSGHVDEGLETLYTVLDTAGLKLPKTPRRALLSVWTQRLRVRWRGLGFRLRDSSQVSAEQLTLVDICWAVGAGLSMIDPIRGADFQTRNLLLALRAGEAYRIVRALAIEAAHLAMTEDRAQVRAERILQAADALAREVPHPYAQGVVHMAQGISEYSKGHWRGSRTLFGQAEEIFRSHCTGVAWELDTTHFLSLWALDYLGELAELGRCWPVLVKEAQERGDRYAVTNLCNHLLVMIRLGADDPEGAEEELQRALGLWSHQGFHVQHCLGVAAQAEVLLYRGEDSAWGLLTRHWRDLEDSLLLRVRVIRVFMRHLRARCALVAAARAKDPWPLWRAAERDARRLERERLPWAAAHARLIRGGVAEARGDRSTAEMQFAEAAARYEGIDMHLYAAAARRRRGQIVRGSEGRALTEDADSWMIRQEIRNPARMVSLAAPGFSPRDP
jgi:serine/threonine protein kinase